MTHLPRPGRSTLVPTTEELDATTPRPEFDCQCYAVPHIPFNGSTYIRALLWIGKITTNDPGTAADWFLDRLNLLSGLLEGTVADEAAYWLHTPDARLLAEATLRSGKRIEVVFTDIDQVRYEVLVQPVRKGARLPSRPNRLPNPGSNPVEGSPAASLTTHRSPTQVLAEPPAAGASPHRTVFPPRQEVPRQQPGGNVQVGPYSSAQKLAGANVMVTGGGGLIGSRIVARLRSLGARPLAVCALDAYPPDVYRDLFGVDTSHPDFHVGNVADAALMRRLVSQCDYVIHAAALADVAACTRNPMAALQANVVGTQVLLDAIAACDRVRRLTYVSSASVYGNGAQSTCPDTRALRAAMELVYGRLPVEFSESAPIHPVSVYANTKAWGEAQTALVLEAVGISYSVVRYFSVYGEPQVIKQGSHSWVVAWFATRAALGLPLHLNGGGHQIRDLVHVDDIADATVRALTESAAHNQTLNVGTGTPTSIRDVAELVRDHFPHAQITETPMPLGDPLGGHASTTRMKVLLGWQPRVTVTEGVARYADWLKATPNAVPDWLRSTARGC